MAPKSQEASHKENSKATLSELKALREARGLSLADVCQSTKISILNLEFIEKGEFHRLPPPIYTKAYLKAYASLLSADEKPLMECYENYLRDISESAPEMPDLPRRALRPYYKYMICAGLLLAAVLIILFNQCPVEQNLDRQPAKSIPGSAPPSKVSENTEEGSTAGRPEAAAPAGVSGSDQATGDVNSGTASSGGRPAPSAERIAVNDKNVTGKQADRLLIKAGQLTWLRIREDEKESYQVLMKPGEQLELHASQFSLDVGNAGGIALIYKDKPLESLGKSGEVVHLRLPQQ